MSSPRKPRVSAEKRRELQVAAAVAREALLQAHVKHALELIGLASNRVSVMRMLDIYVRVNSLPNADAELVTTRVLAMLGESTADGDRPLVYVEGESDLAGNLPLVGVVRDRLRGRALNDLRRWVELHTGSTQVALLNVYVAHALRFVDMLQETHSIAAALRVYAEFVAVPRTMNDMLHLFVLDRLATKGLPAGPRTEQVQLFPAQPRPRAIRAAAPDRRRKGALDTAVQ
jgi:hypothetical protein